MTLACIKPIYPLLAPGMPLPGSDFIAEANLRTPDDTKLSGKGKSKKLKPGDQLEELIYEALYGEGRLQVDITSKGTNKTRLPIICGHRWSANPRGRSPGPEQCDVMVLGKMLGDQEINYGRCYVGPTGQLLLDSLAKLGVTTEASRWYVTNLVKTTNPDPAGQWRDSLVKNFLHLLHQELRIVRPKYILCLGSDALKALFGKNMTVAKSDGVVLELDIDLRRSVDDTESGMHKALVMGCVHPAAVLRTPDLQGKMEQALARFVQLVHGERWDQGEPDLDHRIIDNEDDLRALVDEIRALGPGTIIAADAEWHGDHPQNTGSYLRTIQVSWAHKSAACIVLNGAGGVPAFKRRVGGGFTADGGFDVAIDLIREIFRDNRPCGHYFTADLEWFVYYGLHEVAHNFAPPEDWRDCKHKGGLDTANLAHAVDETGDFSLTAQALQRTSAPRYDVPLLKWKERYCRENGLKAKELEGYGMCPDEILYPYALYDADVTRRIAVALLPELDSDRFGNNCWEPFWISQRAALGVLEMKTTGLVLDRKRVDEMTSLYAAHKQLLADKIRRWARWPDLNLESVYQVREFLFGACYNGTRTPDGKVVKLRPKGARTLGAIPLVSTEKRPRMWTDLSIPERKQFSPSTNKMALGMMVHYGSNLPVRTKDGVVRRDYKNIVQLVRDYRFVSQVLKSVLRKPCEDENGLIITTDDGNWVYKGGIAGSVCCDGRVRTTIYTTKETGRWSSARPPLQNLSKRREPDYKRILGDAYPGPLRSILCAPPGYVLVEADYIGAELFAMAVLSGDPTMMDHAARNQLPENHPDYYDIHSNVCILAFNFDCPPTKAGLASIGKKHLRIIAKAVIFGVAYGRGAKAIALAAKEEGIEITTEEAQAIVDAIFNMYPGLVPFFNECKMRAASRNSRQPARWLQGSFGRYRRFPIATDDKIKGDFERQAQNFPIQGLIADAVSIAVGNMYEYPRDEIDFLLCLQVHDAIASIVRNDCVARYVDEVLPACMVQGVPIYPRNVDGTPQGNGPYYLGIDTDVNIRWGVKPMPNELLERGIDPKYSGWKEKHDGYVSEESFPGKVWRNGALRAI